MNNLFPMSALGPDQVADWINKTDSQILEDEMSNIKTKMQGRENWSRVPESSHNYQRLKVKALTATPLRVLEEIYAMFRDGNGDKHIFAWRDKVQIDESGLTLTFFVQA